MGVPGNANLLLLRSAAAAGSYQVSRSLRFNAPDSAYLSRTPSVAGNRKTWTWAGWVKRSVLGSPQQIFGSYNYPNPAYYDCGIQFNSSDQLYFYNYDTSAWNGQLTTAAVFRDTAAYYHVVVSCDTTAATPVKIYVNGVQQTLSGTQPSASSNTAINYTSLHVIGTYTPISGNFYFVSGYLADIFLIDGQQLDPSSFTTTDPTTGQLIPVAYSGSYGTNGFHLPFSDNSATTATTLGKDTSGNGNNWTPNNFSVTAGAGNDSLVDTPVSSGTDSPAGGVVTGNYCTWNPLTTQGPTANNGNLDLSWSTNSWRGILGSIGMQSGKWYWEITVNSLLYTQIGIALANTTVNDAFDNIPNCWGYASYDGRKMSASSGGAAAYGNSYGVGDVIGVAFDADAGSIYFYKNGTVQNSGTAAYTGLTNGPYAPAITMYSSCTFSVNFGQRPFAYQTAGTNRPASTYKALVDTSLPSPQIAKPSTVMDVLTWTGTGGNRTLTGLGFSPDFVWGKARSAAGYNHQLFDIVRGAGSTKDLSSSLTAAEGSATTDAASYGYLSSFTSDGFGTTTGSVNNAYWNGSSTTYVAWCWDAGTSTVTNTQGSITSSVRANPSAGFSVVTWSYGTSTATVGHGLGVTPGLIIAKGRTSGQYGAGQWIVYHSALGVNQYIYLSSTNAAASNISGVWSGTNSSVFKVDNGLFLSSIDYVAYAFAPVTGYSSMGSYVGNGSADGPFVYTGMRPRFLIYKRTDAADTFGWIMIDSLRDSYNVATKYLGANTSAAEGTTNVVDFLSNGFKLRVPGADGNVSGGTYVYAAFAESPLQYARAR